MKETPKIRVISMKGTFELTPEQIRQLNSGLWSEEDELGYQIGDMHGEWERPEKPLPPTFREQAESYEKMWGRDGIQPGEIPPRFRKR